MPQAEPALVLEGVPRAEPALARERPVLARAEERWKPGTGVLDGNGMP